MTESSNLYFIKAPCHQSSREQGFQFAPDEVKQTYDFEIAKTLFDGSMVDTTNKKIELCKGYELLYQHILQYVNLKPNDKVITIGGDHSIATGTIAAMNEKYMKLIGNRVTSELLVLWIDSYPDTDDFNTSSTKNLNEMPVASLLGLCGTQFTKNKLLLDKNQLIYYGLVDKDDNLDDVKKARISHFTVKKINSIGLSESIKAIQNMISNKPVHVSLDMKVFDSSLIKSVIPQNDAGLKLEQVSNLLANIKNNIVSMDIVEFNPSVGSTEDVKITRETIRYILTKTFDIKEKTLNIFSEDSQFLVFRPIQQEDPYTDIGWYILRGLQVNDKNELISRLENDKIITIEVDDEEYLVTKTTINEQNEKSFYMTETINDVTLFPQEKICMAFELIN